MSHHTPEDIRRIMLLLRGKKRAGREIGRMVGHKAGKVLPRRMEYDPASKEGGEVGPEIASMIGMPASDIPHNPSRDVRESLTPELMAMIQLLASGQEAKSRLRARGVSR